MEITIDTGRTVVRLEGSIMETLSEKRDVRRLVNEAAELRPGAYILAIENIIEVHERPGR